MFPPAGNVLRSGRPQIAGWHCSKFSPGENSGTFRVAASSTSLVRGQIFSLGIQKTPPLFHKIAKAAPILFRLSKNFVLFSRCLLASSWVFRLGLIFVEFESVASAANRGAGGERTQSEESSGVVPRISNFSLSHRGTELGYGSYHNDQIDIENTAISQSNGHQNQPLNHPTPPQVGVRAVEVRVRVCGSLEVLVEKPGCGNKMGR